MRRLTIAVVDDDPDFQSLLQGILEDADYRVVLCDRPDKVHDLIVWEQPQLVIVAVRLNEQQTALTLLAHLRGDASTHATPVLVCSADRRFFRRYGAELEQLDVATLELPFDLDELLAQIAGLLAPGVTAPEHQALPAPRRLLWPSR